MARQLLKLPRNHVSTVETRVTLLKIALSPNDRFPLVRSIQNNTGGKVLLHISVADR